MPTKSWFAALLALALFAGKGKAQQPFDPSSFGELAERVTARSSPPRQLRSEPATASSGDRSPELVLPAVYESPDRDLGALQQAGYTTPPQTPASYDALPLSRRASERLAASAEASEPSQSPPRSESDLGYPALTLPEKKQPGAKSASPSGKGMQATLAVISSLAMVLGLFFVTAWCLRRTGVGGLATLPSDVFETLGRAPLTNRQQVHLLRCGSKLLLVSVTPDGAETLAEIDEPDEVVRLTGLCKANHAGSAAVAFRQVLRQFAKEPAEPGFVGRTEPDLPRAHRPSELENLHG